jgi:hypothetical protein
MSVNITNLPCQLLRYCIIIIFIVMTHLSLSAAANSNGNASVHPNCSVPNRFLHLGKTGGTAFVTYASHYIPSIEKVDHKEVKLKSVCGHHCAVLFVRDPIDRWISGYYSRYRRGCPMHCSNWTKCETKYFQQFPNVSALAEALYDSSNDTSSGTPTSENEFYHANRMVNYCVRHLQLDFSFYLRDLETEYTKIGYVGLTDNLEAEFQHFVSKFNFTQILKHSFESIHANPSNKTNVLSEKGRINLIKSLAKDYYYMDVLWKKGLIKQRLTPKPVYYY